MHTDEQALLNTADAARFLGLSASTLAKARLSGEGCAYVKLGSAVRYRRADLQAFVASRARRSTSETLAE